MKDATYHETFIERKESGFSTLTSVRQWRVVSSVWRMRMTEFQCRRKLTLQTATLRIVVIDDAYWITDSGTNEIYWRTPSPSEDDAMLIKMLL